MPITSYVEEDHRGQGRGHVEHGNGKGLGHQKHQQQAMEDGVYTMAVSGISVDNPSAVYTPSPQTTLADDAKLNTEVRQGSITIEDAPGDDGDGALRLVTDSGNGRLRVNVEFDANNQVTLGDLDTLSFDFMIASSDRTDVIPVIRLIIDADGDLNTTADRGELVFEWAYQGAGAVAQDVWQTADLVGDDWAAWQRSNGANRDTYPNIVDLSDWSDANGFTPAGGLTFDEDSVVLGFSIALGSGNGTTDAYLDNLQVGGVTYDFVG